MIIVIEMLLRGEKVRRIPRVSFKPDREREHTGKGGIKQIEKIEI